MKKYQYVKEIFNSQATVLKLRKTYKINPLKDKEHFEVWNLDETIKLCTITKKCLENRFKEVVEK